MSNSIMPLHVGKNLRDIRAQKRRELLVDEISLVILDTGTKRGKDTNLVGVSACDGTVLWELGGELESDDAYDGIVNVWIEHGYVWAGTWSGFALQINPNTGQVLQKLWNK